MLQVSRFTDGGFVVHRLRLDGVASRFSVWCSLGGRIQDAARIDSRGVAYRVNPDSPLWRALESRVKPMADNLLFNGPARVARHADYGGSPWAP